MLQVWCYQDNRISVHEVERMVYKVLANGRRQEAETY